MKKQIKLKNGTCINNDEYDSFMNQLKKLYGNIEIIKNDIFIHVKTDTNENIDLNIGTIEEVK